MLAPPNGQVWHRAFFRWVRAQDRSPHEPGIPKNAYGPIGIPLIRGAWRLTQPPEGSKSQGSKAP